MTYAGLNRLSEEYPELLAKVLAEGDDVPSRIGNTKELLDFVLHLREPEYCLVGRTGMHDEFAYEEIAQLLAGVYNEERLRAVVPRAAELIKVATAYGPRVWPQLLYVERELTESPNSRRGIVYIGRPDDLPSMFDPDEAKARAGEVPCTCVWQFHLREEQLSMSVYMRSWDLVWGLSYDVPSFVAIQIALARALNVEVGRYVHHAGSGHVYERHFNIETYSRQDGKLDMFGLTGRTMLETQDRARVELSHSV